MGSLSATLLPAEVRRRMSPEARRKYEKEHGLPWEVQHVKGEDGKAHMQVTYQWYRAMKAASEGRWMSREEQWATFWGDSRI